MRTDRLYDLLLHAYPAAFRDEYGREMRLAFRSRHRAEPDGAARLRLWTSALLDTTANAPRLHAEILLRDLRHAWRALVARQTWAFTAAVLLTLAIGIGAVAATFTVAYNVLLAPLPYRDPDRIVQVYDLNPSSGIESFASSTPNFRSLVERARSFSHLSALRNATANLTGHGEPERVEGLAVSQSFFDLLGVAPLAGRTFVGEDELSGGPRVVLISERLWQRRFGGNQSAIGRTIDVNLVPHTITGVVPQDMGFTTDVDVWLPFRHVPEDDSRGDRRLLMLGRLAPGVTLPQAQEEVGRIAQQLEREFPAANEGWRMHAIPVREWIVDREIGQRVRIVFAAVVLLLLVAIANVTNLQVARAAARLREVAVRLALGASRPRIARQMITESLLLSAIGGTAGLVLAWMVVRAAGTVLPAQLPRTANLSISLEALAVAALCVGAATVAGGLLPARIALSSSVRDVLQYGGRGVIVARARTRRTLVSLQLALATALVISAALLAQSLLRLQRTPLGFAEPGQLLATAITRSDASDESYSRNKVFYEAVLERVRTLPGVIDAAIANEIPLGDSNTEMAVAALPRPAASEDEVQASWRIVSADYFRMLRIPVLRGRTFASRGEPARSMVLSESVANRLWPSGEDPIGRSVRLSNTRVYTVIAVVGDVRHLDVASSPTPTVYMSPSWWLWPTMNLVVRTAGDPNALGMPIREVVRAIDPRQPLSEFRTLEAMVSQSVAAPRLNAMLVTGFGAVALVLAVVGVAGVVSFTVSRRTQELAVRVALGASPNRAMRHVIGDGMLMCGSGVLAGLLVALAMGRALSGVLYGVGAHDAKTFAVAAAALLAASAVACWLPARRAMRINPSVALKES